MQIFNQELIYHFVACVLIIIASIVFLVFIFEKNGIFDSTIGFERYKEQKKALIGACVSEILFFPFFLIKRECFFGDAKTLLLRYLEHFVSTIGKFYTDLFNQRVFLVDRAILIDF